MFGYKADRFEALRTLAAPGGWSSNVWPEAIDLSSDTNSVKSFKQKKDVSQPAISQEDEGLRRPCTDLTLLIFHLFISSFTVSEKNVVPRAAKTIMSLTWTDILAQYSGVDIEQARAIVNYNLTLYPEGVFFLFLKGLLPISAPLFSGLTNDIPYRQAARHGKQTTTRNCIIRERWLLHICYDVADLTDTTSKAWILRVPTIRTSRVSLNGSWVFASWRYVISLAHCRTGRPKPKGRIGQRLAFCSYGFVYGKGNEPSLFQAVYRYGLAATLYDLATTEKDQSDAKKHMKEAIKWFEQVPGSMKKIAGKHIPVEVDRHLPTNPIIVSLTRVPHHRNLSAGSPKSSYLKGTDW